jgi:hypothetical protein
MNGLRLWQFNLATFLISMILFGVEGWVAWGIAAVCAWLTTRNQPLEKKEFGLAGGVWLFLLLAMYVGPKYLDMRERNVQEAVAPNVAVKNVGQETRAYVSRQDSEGVLNDQINVEVANAIGDDALKRMKFHVKRSLKETGISGLRDEMTQGTILLQSDGVNLVFTRISLGKVNYFLQVAGVKGKELVRVSCMSPRADVSVILAGKCADALKEQFNFEMPEVTP